YVCVCVSQVRSGGHAQGEERSLLRLQLPHRGPNSQLYTGYTLTHTLTTHRQGTHLPPFRPTHAHTFTHTHTHTHSQWAPDTWLATTADTAAIEHQRLVGYSLVSACPQGGIVAWPV